MRTLTSLRLLTIALFVVVLLPTYGWANATKNCPTEPAQGVPIGSGDTYFGSNCVLSSPSDLDTFSFNAKVGDIWIVAVGMTSGESYPNNICVEFSDPNGNNAGSACSNTTNGQVSASVTTAQLTVGGAYTIIVDETEDQVVSYGVSLERISPPPSDGTALTVGKTISSGVDTPTAQDAFTFYGATSGTYDVIASMTSGGYPQNLCFVVYQPGGGVVVGGCTNTANGTTTVEETFKPSANGTYVILVYESGNNSTLGYTLSATCVAGTCPNAPPTCALTDAASYNATTGTLTMNFTVATPVAATWSGWLVSGGTVTSLWSQSQPITEPAVTVPETDTLGKSGRVGILSTLSTATAGITCSSWTLVNTGAP